MDLAKKLQRSTNKKIVVPAERENLRGLKNGDMRLTKDSTGLKLNVKYNNKLYETLLRNRQEGLENKYRDSSISTLNNTAIDTSVTKNVWLGLDMATGKTTGITTTKFVPVFFSSNAKILKLSWVGSTVGAGTWGFKIMKYNKTGAITSLLNFVDKWVYEKSFTPGQGKDNHVKVDLDINSGDICAFLFKVPIVAGATWLGMSYEIQNKINKKR
ncbi:MAG: hypothetical protein Unbinned4409contig1002_30 [Prokaryotic dsDNA virus sp.]|nr:MAG: hypothetical protein Unbinned4409contig1002_30 [Prokaryotic dsDNA virus sp.]|tara:strand:+ start:21007 stop:21648 length:642 start_codon:yes stop_codon:yes gene_type:complete